MRKQRIFAALVSVAAMGAAMICVGAEETPQGHIIFAADKNTIGQGFVVEPVKVPYYEGESGIDVIKRAAADAVVTESDYGAYFSAFADVDTGEKIPVEIKTVCPEMFGRTAEGYLSNYDYTAESGWSFFLNDESAIVGISDYEPTDGDVVWFRFTVYGYGSDLGMDNSAWGGTPALVEQAETAELMTALAEKPELKETDEYKAAIKTLETYGATTADMTASLDRLNSVGADISEADKTSPETGTSGIAALIGGAVLASAVIMCSRKK